MGSLDNITKRISLDASQKAGKSIKEAKREAQEILNKAQMELEREKKAIEQDTEKTIKILRSRAISEAKLEARKMMLHAKENLITQSFEKANERLKNLDLTKNENYLREAIKNGVKLLGSDVEVLCNEDVIPLVTRLASEIDPKISVSSEGISYLGGAVIRAKNGTAQIDATFEGVLERTRNELRREVAEILFGKKRA